MSIYTTVALSILVCVAVLIIKNYSPSIGFIISASSSILLLLICMPKLSSILHILNNISAKAGINQNLFEILIKSLGITYIVEWGVNLCKDAGQNALSAKIELFGKIGVVVIMLPIIEQIINNIISVIK